MRRAARIAAGALAGVVRGVRALAVCPRSSAATRIADASAGKPADGRFGEPGGRVVEAPRSYAQRAATRTFMGLGLTGLNLWPSTAIHPATRGVVP